MIAGVATVGAKPNYRFIHADHPIDMVYAKDGQWLYYFEGGEPKDVADRARKDLIPSGYVEDTAHKPWFHFVKGDREVIVCNHDQIGTISDSSGTSTLMVPPPIPTPRGYNSAGQAVIWVRTPGRGSAAKMTFFQLKKLILRW